MNWYKKSEKYHKGIPKSCQVGDCYCAAGRYLMDHGINKPNLVLVHGEVVGQGKISGISYGHAWIEDGDMVIDVSKGKKLELPKVFYYALGQIDESKLLKYNLEQMREKILETGQWGPWDLITKY
jgi:hypothetical protein